MRNLTNNVLLLLLVLVPFPAFGQDPGDTEAAEAAEEAPPPPPAAPALEIGEANIDPPISATVTMVDGKVHKGNLTHVLLARDWYGNDPEPNTQFMIAVDVHLLDLEWKDVKRVSVARPNTSSDMDCYSDEDQDPILWECTLKQTSSLTMRTKHQYSGQYRMDTREIFTFVFDNDASTAVSFPLYKLVANTQNYESMSQALQDLQAILREKNQHSVRSIEFE